MGRMYETRVETRANKSELARFTFATRTERRNLHVDVISRRMELLFDLLAIERSIRHSLIFSYSIKLSY